MNLISQNCLSGNIYKNHLKEEFGNPFIWTVIDFNSMLYLIQNWNTINFKNYELVKDNNWNFSIIIDEKVKVQYVHYIFDPDAKTVQIHCNVRGDIKYCKIWEYIIKKYEERLNRMLDKKEEPIFCICNSDTIYKDAIYTEEQLKLLEKFKNVRILRGHEHSNVVNNANLFYNKFLK